MVRTRFWSPKPLAPGYRFDSGATYVLERKLGSGGMGDVWLARRTSAAGHHQAVALKFVQGAEESDRQLADEALRISHLVHDNIAGFVDSGRDDEGRFFVAITYIDGCDLDGLVAKLGGAGRRTARIPDAIVGFIAFMVLRALHYAHTHTFPDASCGILHRDISPGNILIDATCGFVKVTDFGVAAAIDAGPSQAVGKLPYMAPEILMEEAAGPPADLYSLGVVLYELLTGVHPSLRITQSHSLLGAISEIMLALDRPLRAPHELVVGVDERLSTIVTTLLAKDPADRFASAEEAMAQVGSFLYDDGFGPTTDSLADYLALLDGGTPSEAQRARLRFLDWSIPEPWRPPLTYTEAAVQALSRGDNPARGPASP